MAPLSLTHALNEGRERTLALVEALSDADLESQHVEIMSPLVWDLAHIAAYEELWLVHREAGLPLSRPGGAEVDDAFEWARAARGRPPPAARPGAGVDLPGGRAPPHPRPRRLHPRAGPPPRAPARRDDA